MMKSTIYNRVEDWMFIHSNSDKWRTVFAWYWLAVIIVPVIIFADGHDVAANIIAILGGCSLAWIGNRHHAAHNTRLIRKADVNLEAYSPK